MMPENPTTSRDASAAADVFISYAHEDRALAAQLASILDARGWSVWFDQRLYSGDDFRKRIDDQLERCRCVLVVWSAASIASRYVIDEADHGVKRGVIVQALLQTASPPLGFRALHAVDLGYWSGAIDDRRVEDLIGSIRRLAGVPVEQRDGLWRHVESHLAVVHRQTIQDIEGLARRVARVRQLLDDGVASRSRYRDYVDPHEAECEAPLAKATAFLDGAAACVEPVGRALQQSAVEMKMLCDVLRKSWSGTEQLEFAERLMTDVKAMSKRPEALYLGDLQRRLIEPWTKLLSPRKVAITFAVLAAAGWLALGFCWWLSETLPGWGPFLIVAAFALGGGWAAEDIAWQWPKAVRSCRVLYAVAGSLALASSETAYQFRQQFSQGQALAIVAEFVFAFASGWAALRRSDAVVPIARANGFVAFAASGLLGGMSVVAMLLMTSVTVFSAEYVGLAVAFGGIGVFCAHALNGLLPPLARSARPEVR